MNKIEDIISIQNEEEEESTLSVVLDEDEPKVDVPLFVEEEPDYDAPSLDLYEEVLYEPLVRKERIYTPIESINVKEMNSFGKPILTKRLTTKSLFEDELFDDVYYYKTARKLNFKFNSLHKIAERLQLEDDGKSVDDINF